MTTVTVLHPKAGRPATPLATYDAIIVGCGFGGMGQAIQLERLGLRNILMLDQASDLGGTWHINRYPGLAVDIASVTYCYSFEPNPYWTRLYAPGAELKAYADHVAEKYRLRRHMRFNSTVEKVLYNEAGAFWTVFIENQPALSCRLLILATGYLSHPKRPDIPGLADFQGKVIHTAAWEPDYDLAGKRAAVIGTGATAVQLIPKIAKQLKQLDVYQRTPVWVSPKLDPKIPDAVQKLFAAVPATQRGARFVSSSILELVMVSGALHNKQLPFLTRLMERYCTAHLHSQVKDATLRQQLTPQYSFGCKRPTFSNSYFRAFNRDNVKLLTSGIDHIEADAIVSKSGERRAIDTLILATGFKVWEQGNFPAFPVIGRGGVELGAWWNDNRFQAYEGITVPGFPNLFNLPSPYSFTGLSYFFTIEGQMKHIARCVGEMQKRGAKQVEIRPEANAEFLRQMRGKLGSSVFVNGNCGGANSYYFNQHGEASLLRPTPTFTALWRAGHFPLEHYWFG